MTKNITSLVFPKIGIGCWSYGGGDYWGDQTQLDVDAVYLYKAALQTK